jgi:SAM-dependent methyltransferase
LPFQDAVFRTVILFMITQNGTERELDEACRVLAPGGELVVLGLNRSGWSGLNRYRRGPVPRMHVASVRNSLQAHDMDINRVLGAGLFGRARPLMEWNRPSGIVLPLADLVVLRARHRARPAATRLRMKEFSARALPTAINTA